MAGYDDLKRIVESMARDELRMQRPKYVAAYQRELLASGDLRRSEEVAHEYLGRGLERWPRLLTSLFDLEYVRWKLANTHRHLEDLLESGDATAGYWFSYHLDHWIFEADAFVNRCMQALTLSVRTLVRPVDKDRQSFLMELRHDVQAIKDELGKVRHKLAHGGGGGVDGLIEKWEPVLAAPVPLFCEEEFVRQSVEALHRDVPVQRRRLWFDAVHRSNVLIFAYSEAWAGKIVERLAVPGTGPESGTS